MPSEIKTSRFPVWFLLKEYEYLGVGKFFLLLRIINYYSVPRDELLTYEVLAKLCLNISSMRAHLNYLRAADYIYIPGKLKRSWYTSISIKKITLSQKFLRNLNENEIFLPGHPSISETPTGHTSRNI